MTQWKEFLGKCLIDSNLYRIDKYDKIGDTEILIYVSININDKTYFKVGFLDDDLMFFYILNPETPGNNEYQEREYFYRNDFTQRESYGDPGLEFNVINMKGIKDLLKFGLRGREIKYFRDDILIKSKVFRLYNDYYSSDYGITIWFQKDNIFKRLREAFSKNKKELTTKEIQLDKIFSGLNLKD